MTILSYVDFVWGSSLGEPLPEECKPNLWEDIAPFPVWLVPPMWRMANLDDIEKAAGDTETLMGVTLNPYYLSPEIEDKLKEWFPRLGIVRDTNEPFKQWFVRSTCEIYILWKTTGEEGKEKKQHVIHIPEGVSQDALDQAGHASGKPGATR